MKWIPTFRPGSVLWLLMHESKLYFYSFGESKKNGIAARGLSGMEISLCLFVYILIHLGAKVVLSASPRLTAEPSWLIIMAAGAVLPIILGLMISLSIKRSINSFFIRGDLDLLMTSPLRSKTIFSVRLAAIVLGVASLFLLFLSPFANVGILTGQFRWGSIYPALLSISTIVASTTMVITTLLVRFIGVRYTLIAAQCIGLITGACVFLVSQFLSSPDQHFRDRINAQILPLFKAGGILDEHSLYWIPARALIGSTWDLVIIITIATLCFSLTSRFLHRYFIRGVQHTDAQFNKTKSTQSRESLKLRDNKTRPFMAGVTKNIILKEWRTISRDPQLISQVALQIFYMLPMLYIVLRDGTFLPGVAAGITFLSTSLAGSLIWIIIAAEDSPDLLRVSPVSPKQVLTSKIIAAMLPVTALLSPALGYFAFLNIKLALALTFIIGVAMGCSILIHLWLSKSSTREKFAKRGQTQLPIVLLNALSGLLWSTSVYVGMTMGIVCLIPMTFAVLTLGIARILRVTQDDRKKKRPAPERQNVFAK